MIEINGTNPNATLKQRWNFEARASGNNVFAFFMNGFVDGNEANIDNEYLVLQMGSIDSQSEGAYLRSNYPGATRQLIVIPSAVDQMPASLYYGLH